MVLCPICNKSFKTLCSHLRKHKISGKDFLILYPNCILVPDEIRKQTSETSKNNGCGKWTKGRIKSESERRSISERTKGDKNPFYGKKHSEKTKKRMSENHADFTGDKNPFKNWIKDEYNYKKWINNLHENHCSKNLSEADYILYCEELSEKASKAYLDGTLKPYGHNHKHGHYKSVKFNEEFYYQSSYELRFLEFCELNQEIKILVKSPYRIKYKIENKNYNYIPDFLINNQFLIEIKPESMLDFDKNPYKFKAAKKFCKKENIKYLIITEKELDNLSEFFSKINNETDT